MDTSTQNDNSRTHGAGGASTFIKIFAWSIIVIGFICCVCMLSAAAPQNDYYFGESTPWNQGLVVNAIIGFLMNVLLASLILRIAKSDAESANIEWRKPFVVTQLLRTLSILGVVFLVSVLIWSVTNRYEFARALAEGLLSGGSLSDLLTLNRIVDNRGDLIVLVRIMLVVWTWYWIGAYFVWGALARVLGRVVTASAMKEVYERKIRALEASQPKADEAKA